jgi:hypothetical protein
MWLRFDGWMALRRALPSGAALLGLLTAPGMHGQSPDPGAPWLAYETARLDEAAQNGATNALITFSVYRLLWHSLSVDALDPGAVAAYHTLIGHAAQLDLRPIGTSTVWIFPPAAGAPLVPPDPLAEGIQVPERLVACVPGLDTAEYVRLRGLRARMWTAYVHEFTEINTWIVGIEEGYDFYACDGRQLPLEVAIPFIADTLRDLKQVTEAERPEATVIAHFLGVSGIPLIIDGRVVQPREVLERLLAEIEGRGHSTSDYFDELATVLDPNLLNDRHSDAPPPPGPPASDTPPTPVPGGQGAQVALAGKAAFEDPIRLIFWEFLRRNAPAAELHSRLGLQFMGSGGSSPRLETVEVFRDFGGIGLSVAVRNVSPDGGDSAGRPLLLRFRDPVRRVGLILGNGTAETVARLEAFTARGESLGSVEYVGPETKDTDRGPFVGIETAHPEGIATLVVDYGAEVREEYIHEIWLEYLVERPFRLYIPQLAVGRVGSRQLEMLLQLQTLYTWSDQEVVVRFFDSAGEPLELTVDGTPRSDLSLRLAYFLSVRVKITAPEEEGVEVGYAEIESKLPLAAQGIYRVWDEETGQVNEIGIEAQEAKVFHVFPVDWEAQERLDTGFAIVNPGDQPAEVTLRPFDPDNRFKPPWLKNWPQLTLLPGEHKALFLSEICGLPQPSPLIIWCYEGSFPVEEDFASSLLVVSDQPVAVTSLRTRQGWLISSLPVGSTQR